MSEILAAWTTVGDADRARQLAAEAVELHLAACVQIEGPIISVYRWKDRIETSEEWRLLFKFHASLESALRVWLLEHHPYEMPEWLVVPVQSASPAYANWVFTESAQKEID